jgi:hypothetical protein
MSLHMDDLSPPITMTNVPNSIATELLKSAPAANDDRLDESVAPGARLGETSGWDAHEVWRRLIKDARDRRRSDQPPE